MTKKRTRAPGLSLREKQSLFVLSIADLIAFAYMNGYELTWGETWRSAEEAARLAKIGKGIRQSLHTLRLAVDFNLFQNGVWLKKTEDHLPLGEWWELHHPLARWGGRWGDGNHYSFEHNGRK